MRAAKDLNFGPLGTIRKGDTITLATEAQIEKCKKSVTSTYKYYTENYKMFLAQLKGESIWLFKSDVIGDTDSLPKKKVILNRQQIEGRKNSLAEIIRSHYKDPMAEVIVSRDYGADPKYGLGPKCEGGYVAKVETVGGQCRTGSGLTELKALKSLLKNMKLRS